MKAMIFAAGLGSRLRPLTDNCPKALVPIGGKPMLEQVILRLKAAEFDHLVINVHHFGQQIIDFLAINGNFGLRIDISDERELLLDTGGAIKKARPLLDGREPFLIYNVDILTDLNPALFYEAHIRSGADASLLTSQRDTSRYLLFDAEGKLQGWENRKTGEVRSAVPCFIKENSVPYAFGGVHLFSPALFPLMDEWPDCFPVIDFYLAAAPDHRIQGHPFVGMWMDLGKPAALEEAERYWNTAATPSSGR